MLVFLQLLSKHISVLNVFRYITFRTIYASLTALAISFILGPWLIRKLREMQVGQHIREDGPQTHLKKAGTPTMGGVLILSAVIASTLLWADLSNGYVWVVVLVTLGFGLIGFADDHLMQVKKHSKGLSARQKFTGQVVMAGVAGWLMVYVLGADTTVQVPFLKNVNPDITGPGYILFAILVMVGSSNAVNLTDGLDGLAIVPVAIAAAAYMVFAYVSGHYDFATYLQVNHVAQAGELAVICGALVGAGLGFLWYNAYPAQIFMGDVGSLPLGGALGAIALLTKHELALVIVGGLFVMEAVSVMLQVGFFKLTKGKRIFKMAPIHHHFELKGWPEPKVIVRFWIIAIMLALLSLSTLKLR